MKKLVMATILVIGSGCTPSYFSVQEYTEKYLEADPNMSSISISSPNIADGNSDTIITVNLMSNANEPIKDAAIELRVTGSMNVLSACTKTNSQGDSTCRVKSFVAETKNVFVTSPVSLRSWFVMKAPHIGNSLFGFVASGEIQRAVTGHKIISTSGIVESNVIQKDSFSMIRLRSSHLSIVMGDN